MYSNIFFYQTKYFYRAEEANREYLEKESENW